MTDTQDTAPAKRMTLSQIVELLLSRGGHERSSVILSRNAKGETQIEVAVRTGDDTDINTVVDCERRAAEVFDRLRSKYPLSTGYTGATATEPANPKPPKRDASAASIASAVSNGEADDARRKV